MTATRTQRKRKGVELTLSPEAIESASDARLRALLDQWRQDTAFLSSASDICDHPAYRQIIATGTEAIPFLLHEMECGTGHLHDALASITGVDPVSDDDAGDETAIAVAWRAWGRNFVSSARARSDPDLVQPGYWTAVMSMLDSLPPLPAEPPESDEAAETQS